MSCDLRHLELIRALFSFKIIPFSAARIDLKGRHPAKNNKHILVRSSLSQIRPLSLSIIMNITRSDLTQSRAQIPNPIVGCRSPDRLGWSEILVEQRGHRVWGPGDPQPQRKAEMRRTGIRRYERSRNLIHKISLFCGSQHHRITIL